MSFLSSFLQRAASARSLLVFTLSFGALFLAVPLARAMQDQPKPVNLSGDEATMADKIVKAADDTARLQAAEEFIKKYPQSALRPQLVERLSQQIANLPDNAQKITLAERYLVTFNGPGEGDILTPVLVISYITAKKFDDAFRVGASWLEKNPNDAVVLANLAFHAVDQARQGNQKFINVAQDYGTRAVALFESDQKPARYTDDAQWKQTKDSWLPQLHQSLGLLFLVGSKPADAIKHLEKAAALNANDAATFYLLASAKDDEYRLMAAQYQSAPAGAAKDELLGKINVKLDEIIDLFAHAAALAEKQPQHQQLREQAVQSMTTYYKFRHKGSTDGMQALIDKHKKPATP
jgi:tetratricopeptide (TPR) repeat protein